MLSMKLKSLFVLLIILIGNFSYSNDLSPYIKILNQVVLPYMQQQEIPGVAIGLYAEGQGVLISYGVADIKTNKPITSNTLFEIASITKLFTATELALKVEKGEISLDDRLTDFLPDIPRGEQPAHQITLLQLATHSSSLPRTIPFKNRNNPYTRNMIRNFLLNWEPENEIGTEYLYSNLGFGLLGLALQNNFKKPFEELIKEDILIPLKMNETIITITPKLLPFYAQGYSTRGEPIEKLSITILPGSSALRSSSADMLKFLEANLGISGPKELLKAMQMTQKEYFPVNDMLGLGLAWQRVHLDDLFIIDKNGGVPGFSSYIGMLPEKKIGIVLLANKAKIGSTQFGRLILRHLATKE
jgi:beta-lactamase class C